MAHRVAVVQARMGSTRFPGKVLADLAGMPVIRHVIERLRACRNVDRIVIATSSAAEDDPLAAYAESLGVDVLRGDERDVLSRFVAAARRYDADIVIRITGDCPLIDPELIDLLTGTLEANPGYDACYPDRPVCDEGLEPLSRAVIERLAAEAADDAVAREHVSGYFRNHPDFARVILAPFERDRVVKGLRLSVDTPADLAFLQKLYDRLKVPAPLARIDDVVALLRREPDLMRINSHVRQKPVGQQEAVCLILADGGGDMGYGHLTRCAAIAGALRDGRGYGVRFAVRHAGAAAWLRERGLPVRCVDRWNDAALAGETCAAVLIDSRLAVDRSLADAWRRRGVFIAALDDPGINSPFADIAFYPPVPGAAEASVGGERRVGWDWVVLGRPPLRAVNMPRKRLLVTMGGRDPWGLSAAIVAAMPESVPDKMRLTLVLGPGYGDDARFEQALQQSPHDWDVIRAVGDMRPLMAEAAVAIAAFGVSAYELAAHATPSVLICPDEDQARSAGVFADAGLAICIAGDDDDAARRACEAALALLADKAALEEMARKGPALIDGRGGERIVAVLAEAMAGHRFKAGTGR